MKRVIKASRNNIYEQMDRLAQKAKNEWNKNWRISDMEYNADSNTITVWVCEPGCYKAFFDPDTLECVGTKC